MNMTILAGLPREFETLETCASMGEDIESRLAALVKQTREAAGSEPGWQHHVEKVRGKLKLRDDPNGFFVRVIIPRLTALIEGA